MTSSSRPFLLRALAGVPVLALGACASLPAPPAAPAAAPAAVAERWWAPPPAATAAAPGEPTSADAAALARWWQRFEDPLLLQLQAAAQAASPSLSAARSRIEQARAGLVQAQARGLPMLDAAAAARQGRDAPSAPRVNSLSLGVQAAWEIDLFGGNAAASRAAQQRLQASQAAWQGVRVALAADVAASYAALRACEGQLAQARSDAASRAETARLTELSAKAGFQAPANAALASASAAQGQALVTAQAAACEALVKALVALTALPEPQLREQLRPGSAQLPRAGALRLTVLPAALLAQRPDVYAAAREVAASAADIAQADAQAWPRLGLSGNLAGVRVQTAGGPSDSGTTFAIGPVQLTLPLLDGGLRRAQSAAARARFEDAGVQYQASVRQAVREVEEALIALDSTAARDADARRAALGFDAHLRAADARLRGGLGSLFELEDARRTATAAQSALIELQRERFIAWVNLYRALGGGFDAADPKLSGRFDAADSKFSGGINAADPKSSGGFAAPHPRLAVFAHPIRVATFADKDSFQ